MNVRMVVLLLAVSSSSAAFGDVIVTPPSPTSIDTITIVVQNIFGGGHLVSDSITQVGNTFVIQQNIEVVCSPPPPPPSIPYVASQFQVGPLAPGAYNVTATINVTTCSLPMPPLTQTAAFAVTPPLNTPALDGLGLLVLSAALAVSALAVLSVRR